MNFCRNFATNSRKWKVVWIFAHFSVNFFENVKMRLNSSKFCATEKILTKFQYFAIDRIVSSAGPGAAHPLRGRGLRAAPRTPAGRHLGGHGGAGGGRAGPFIAL